MSMADQRRLEEDLMVALRSIRQREHLWLKDQCLLGADVGGGGIAFGGTNPHGQS